MNCYHELSMSLESFVSNYLTHLQTHRHDKDEDLILMAFFMVLYYFTAFVKYFIPINFYYFLIRMNLNLLNEIEE
jgi:hypothetical protein